MVTNRLKSGLKSGPTSGLMSGPMSGATSGSTSGPKSRLKLGNTENSMKRCENKKIIKVKKAK